MTRIYIYILDEEGRKTGYTREGRFNEIPGASLPIIYGGIIINDSQKTNDRKIIYLSEKVNVTLVIEGSQKENYTLMIAGGDYYTKIEGVKTKKGHVDTMISQKDSLKIDFDDKKIGNYTLVWDNFDNVNDGSIYYRDVSAIGNPQKYLVDWSKLDQGKDIAVDYSFEGEIIINEEVLIQDDINSKFILLFGIIILLGGLGFLYTRKDKNKLLK